MRPLSRRRPRVRIELLRARAAIERETLAAGQAGYERTGNACSSGARPAAGLALKRRFHRWPLQAIRLARRHPIISSALPALLMGRGKRGSIVRLAAVGLAGSGSSSRPGRSEGAAPRPSSGEPTARPRS